MFIKKEVHSQVHKSGLCFITELHAERLPIKVKQCKWV